MARQNVRLIARFASFLTVGALTALTGCSSAPSAPAKPAASSASFAFWPQFPDEPHIQFIRSFNASTDVTPATTSGLDKIVFGAESNDEKGIKKPYGIEMRDGKIYVCDMRSSSITVLDLRKKQTRLIGVSGANRLKHPVDVAVADDGMIYVADNDRGGVIVFDKDERYFTAIGHEKFKPVSVATFGDRLYVCDMTGQDVEIYNRMDGKKIGAIGAVGDEDGQFRLPLGVDTDPQGNIYVTDMMRCRVQKFAPDGKLISAMGQLGDYAGTFARPKHIAVDKDGIVYVVDSAFQNVQMFDAENHLLMHFGASGPHPGSMDLPVGICVDKGSLDLFKDAIHPGFEATGIIAVTNQFGNNKVSLYAVGKRRESYSLSDLASRASKVVTGTGASNDQLKLQQVGSEEPTDPNAPADPAADASPQGPVAPPAPEAPKKPDPSR